MEDEFEKIMNLFGLDSKEKEKKLEEIFKASIEFIEKFKHIRAEGTEEQKEDMKIKLGILKQKIAEESKASEKKLSLSKEEIKELSKDQKNFTPEQWELLQKTKETINEEKSVMASKKQNALDTQLKNKKMSANKTKKRRSKRGSSRWLKS